MQVGDLVWSRWDTSFREVDGYSTVEFGSTVGVIIEILHDDNTGQAHYRVHWSDGVPDSLEFEYDLVTKEEKCK